MKIKTSELSGEQLDRVVAHIQGYAEGPNGSFWITEDDCVDFKPSTDWAQGGPIIEREKIGVWWATHYVDDEGQEYGNHWYAETTEGLVGYGPTPLIAAMRCFVRLYFVEVEVPDELKEEEVK